MLFAQRREKDIVFVNIQNMDNKKGSLNDLLIKNKYGSIAPCLLTQYMTTNRH